MPSFVMLTRIDPGALGSAHALEELEKRAAEAVRKQCPKVKWLSSYAVLGPYDYVDVFEAPDIETAAKVSTLMRVSGRAHSEIWAATEWSKFKKMVHDMPS
ncbi:MAG TPA: GYD domain-containing protein [Burkholderiales bacterium]|nr:GYD domain-containing protein [Burkholderiales bacterium]